MLFTTQVYVWRGSGRVLVNRKPLDAYFPDLLMRSAALRPLSVTGLLGQVDVLVQVGAETQQQQQQGIS
jgi:ribosomal protein S9